MVANADSPPVSSVRRYGKAEWTNLTPNGARVCGWATPETATSTDRADGKMVRTDEVAYVGGVR